MGPIKHNRYRRTIADATLKSYRSYTGERVDPIHCQERCPHAPAASQPGTRSHLLHEQ
jgi:hypothetical protein